MDRFIDGRRGILALVCVLFLLIPAGCKTTDFGIRVGKFEEPAKKPGPPPHAKAYGARAKHNYHYYPSSGVYFDSGREVYFYISGDKWEVSVSLPKNIQIEVGSHVTLELETDTPYIHYDDHKKKYPPGQMKKKKKGKGKKWK